jgi:hypothetical protein
LTRARRVWNVTSLGVVTGIVGRITGAVALLDPYAKAVEGELKWYRSLFG